MRNKFSGFLADSGKSRYLCNIDLSTMNYESYQHTDPNPRYPSDEDDEAPLYSIEDDDAEDDSYNNSENDSDEIPDDTDDEMEGEQDESENESEANGDAERKPSPLSLMIKTMLTPVEGWKALKRARLSTDSFASGCFLPCVSFAALIEIIKIFYEANYTIGSWLLDTVSTFLIFFFGYFSVILIGGAVLPKKARVLMHKDIGKQFVMLNISTLALFWALIELVPMLDPVLVFLPLWTIYLIYKGVRVIRVPSDVENSTTGYLCLLIIGLPLLWNWVINEWLFPLTGV